jgi:hypothetical protein
MPVFLPDGKFYPEPVRLFHSRIINRRICTINRRRNDGKFIHPANLRQFIYNLAWEKASNINEEWERGCRGLDGLKRINAALQSLIILLLSFLLTEEYHF